MAHVDFSPPFSKVIRFMKFNMRSNESSEFSVLSHSRLVLYMPLLCSESMVVIVL